MSTTSQLPVTRAWAPAIAHPAAEFSPTRLSLLSGKIPTGLRGSLYRNGPARLERGGSKVGHWFDGDGAILAVHFTPEGATALYRYVQTAGYQAETKAGKFLYGNYGMTAPGPLWNHWLRPVKHTANTSVLPLPDRLLALWEGGNPYALDLQSLETIGLDNLAGLKGAATYSAHCKCDPGTGEIFNFGIIPGLNATLALYKSDYTGRIQQAAEISLSGIPLVHDFVMAGPYLIFFIPPVRLNLLPVTIGLGSFSDSLKWQADQPVQILIVDRETLSVISRGEAEPSFQWHFGNACVDADGSIVLDLVRYPDFQTNKFLQEVATGAPHTVAPGTLWRVRLEPQTGRIQESQQVLDRACEFPVINPYEVGQSWQYTYLAVHHPGVNPGQELFGAIARFDHRADSLMVADMGANRYPMEPIYAPDAGHPELGWIITVVYDGNTNTSEIWVYDSEHLDQPPVCRLGLPQVIPFGFHGKWNPAKNNL